MASSVATAVATGPTRERWKGWKGRKGRMLRNASDDYLVKWLVGLFGLVFFVWLCSDVGLCFACFCLFVWLVGWLVGCLLWLIGWGHKGIFELDENPRQLGSAGSPMKLIDPPILSELSIGVERDLNRNGN